MGSKYPMRVSVPNRLVGPKGMSTCRVPAFHQVYRKDNLRAAVERLADRGCDPAPVLVDSLLDSVKNKGEAS